MLYKKAKLKSASKRWIGTRLNITAEAEPWEVDRNLIETQVLTLCTPGVRCDVQISLVGERAT